MKLYDLPTVVDTLSTPHSLPLDNGQDRLTKQLHHRRRQTLSFEHLQNKRPFIIDDETDPFPTVLPMDSGSLFSE